MKTERTIVPLRSIIEPLTTVNPQKTPQNFFTYIDVSSISRDTLTITDTKQILGKKAPSRARRLVKTNDVIYATVRPTLIRVAVIPKQLNDAVCSTGYYVLRPRASLISKYLFYYLISNDFTDRMGEMQRGASYPAVNDNDIKNEKIPLPPLPEQKRIVAALDKAFARIDKVIANTENNMKNAQELFQSKLNELFIQLKINTRQHVLKNDLKSDWPIVELKNTIKTITPPKKIKKSDYSNSGQFPIIDQSQNKIAGWTNDKKALVDIIKPLVIFGDHTCNIKLLDRTFAQGADGIKIIKTNDDLLPGFLYYLLKNKFAEPEGYKRHYTVLQQSKTLLPSLSVQKHIVAVLNVIESEASKLYDIYTAKRSSLKLLKQSILQKAFSGELTSDYRNSLKDAGV